MPADATGRGATLPKEIREAIDTLTIHAPALTSGADRARAALRAAISRALSDARREGAEEERERVLREVNAIKQAQDLAGVRAAKTGRENVASHRQSDVETCERIEQAVRRAARSGEGD